MGARAEDVLVAGGGGFIGGHLVGRLLQQGDRPAVDVKPSRSGTSPPRCPERQADLSRRDAAMTTEGVVASTCWPPTWAAWASSRTTAAMHAHSPHQHPHARPTPRQEVERYFYSSSACVYAADKQTDPDVTALKRPSLPGDARGRIRLGEAVLRANVPPLQPRTTVKTRVARYHNVYGPHGTWHGGQEKAPAAVCRKVADGQDTGEQRSRSGAMATRRDLPVHRRLSQASQMILEGDLQCPN